MAIANTQTRVQYAGNASSVTPYPVPYPFLDEEWLVVAVSDAQGEAEILTLGLHYSVTGAGNPAGGEIVTTTEVPATSTVTILRRVPLTQLLDLEYNDRLPAAQLEAAYDKLTLICQQLADSLATRAIVLPDNEPAGNPNTLPAPALRKDTVLAFHALDGKLQTLALETIAARVLEIYGLTITPADILAAMSAVAPLVRWQEPTGATPGKSGQLAVVPTARTLSITGSLSPNATGIFLPLAIGVGTLPTYAPDGDEDALDPQGTGYTGPVLYYTNAWILDHWTAGVKTGTWAGLNSGGVIDPADPGITWFPIIGTGTPAVTEHSIEPGRLWVNLADSRLGQPPEWVPFVNPPTVVQVVHGGDSNAIRPANAQTVYWVGYVEPIHAKTWDRWLQTNEIEHE